MKAIVANKYGGPEVLQLKEIEKPVPGDEEILVRVLATTVNAGDSRMRSFNVPPLMWIPARLTLGLRGPKNPVYGMELAGEVEAVGPGVTRFKPGDQVIASTFEDGYGAHAEYRSLREDAAIVIKPESMTFQEAATLPISGNTALHFLRSGNVGPGQKVLIYGASGAVGTFAVQIARSLGAEVTAVCSAGNAALARALGAHHVIDYGQEDFTQNGEIYDAIFDTVGKITFAQVESSLKPGGAYMSTGIAMPALENRRASRSGGKRVFGGTALPTTEGLEVLGQFAESGQLRPVIDRCYPLEDTAEAHRYVDTGRKRGNVVISLENGHAGRARTGA